MTQHTPGPWTAYNRGIGWEVNGPNGEALNDGFRETFSEADARLIAAAPDLLAACKAVLTEPYGCAFCDSGILRTPNNPAKDHENDCPYVLLRAAIARAEAHP